MVWFFTYGSWTDPELMQGQWQRYEKASLSDYVYTFAGEHAKFGGGTSTLIPMPGGTVLGVAYLADEQLLDVVQRAYPQGHLREVTVKVGSEDVQAALLEPHEASPAQPPANAYLAAIRQGLSIHYPSDMVDLYLTRAVKRAQGQDLVTVKTPTPDAFKPEYGGDFRRLFPWNVTHQAAFGSAWMIVHPGESSTPHNHDEEETFIFVSGKGLMKVDGQQFPVGKGDAVYLEPFSAHTVHNTGDIPLEVLCVWWGGFAPA